MAIGTGPQSSRVALNLQEIKPQLQSLLNDFFRSQQDEDSPTKAQRELQQAKRALAALESRQAEQRLVIDSLKAEKKGLQEEIQLQKEEATRLRSALQAALQTEPKALRLDTSVSGIGVV
ncbi:hypothetical protein OF83DRAFT_105682 [Amylostereum chailletii]|nr:hypothetical protein OF83DRAFT_105682 [Amylostereum chailletii]